MEEKVVHMEVGNLIFTTAQPILNGAKEALNNGKTQYTLAPGINELREKNHEHYLQKYNLKICTKRILITPGASGGLTLLANMLVSPGDGILIPDPAYPFKNLFGCSLLNLNLYLLNGNKIFNQI